MEPRENTVLVGRKPVVNYMVSCLAYLVSGEKDVCVKARGRAISRAVDTVELLRQAFEESLEVKNIAIGTEEILLGEGKKGRISTIKIAVAQPLQMCKESTAKTAACQRRRNQLNL